MTNSSVWAGTTRTLQHNVYQGVWTNWSRGRIMGATLTLDRTYGNLLIAFTATFVGIVATAAWRVSCLCFHRIYSSSEPRDTLHHQRQAVLRNSSSAASGFWTVSKLVWTWRHTQDLLTRILPALMLSSLCFCVFTVAAGFSSSISSGVGNEVLLDGHGCGVVDTNSPTPETISFISAYHSQTINNALNYAQECYSSNATGNFDCTNFIKDHLPGTMDDQAGCPFEDGMCRSNQSNLLLDSGYLDSREHFGLNTPDSQRIFFRTTMHCAPVSTQGFSRNISTPVNNYTQYFYGPSIDNMNFTWQTKDMKVQYVVTEYNKMDALAANMGLSVMHANMVNKTVSPPLSSFAPDTRLFRPDADLYLVFLSGNGVAFFELTTDTWYRGFIPFATIDPAVYNETDDWEKTVYRPDEAASPMGCIQQYQYCNAERQCGALASFTDAMTTAAPFLDTPLEAIESHANPSGRTSSQFAWFAAVIYSGYDLGTLISDLGTASLMSYRNFKLGYFGRISSNQWKLDVTHWWTTLLAAKQAAFVSAALGPKDPSLVPNTLRPENEYMEQLCRNQKIRSTKYTSFSLFGLYFTFTVGVLIILASYLLEPIFKCLAHRRKYELYKYIEWTGNETLQLQRMAYQGLGSESWSGYMDSVPRTRPGYFLADLHVAYSGDQNKEVGSAAERSPQTANTQVSQSQANSNTDRPEPITSIDDTGTSTTVRTSSASDEVLVELPDVVSPTNASLLEISPRLTSIEVGSGEPISPTSQAPQPDGPELTVQSSSGSRP